MTPAAPNPGAVARLILQDILDSDPTLTLKSIARRLGVDASLLSHFQSGARVMAVEWLPHLARFYGAEAVYGELVARVAHALVSLPDGEPTGGRIERSLLLLGGAVGEVQSAVAAAREAGSDGGESITAPEKARLQEMLQECAERVAQVQADIGAIPAPTPRRSR